MDNGKLMQNDTTLLNEDKQVAHLNVYSDLVLACFEF